MALPLLPIIFGSTFFASAMRILTIAIIVRFLTAIGATIIIYTGFTAGMDLLQNEVMTLINGLSSPFPQTLALVQRMGIVDYVNIVFAAIGGVFLAKSAAGAVRRLSLLGS